jgi:SAM-dependent methyltransferase
VLQRQPFDGSGSEGESVDAQSRRDTVESINHSPRTAPSLASHEHPANDAQRLANDRVWAGGRHVGAYANRRLRPVEVEILVRYRDALSGRVLELGSGAGRLTGYLATIARSVHGIDLSEEMVAYSRRRYPAASFEQGDMRDPAIFGGECWDAIVAAFNILDVVGDAERHTLLDRIRDALAPGGILVMSTHNRGVAGHLGDPLRLSGMSLPVALWTLVRLPRRWLNRRRFVRFERHEPTYAILNDVGHDYAVMHYYSTRDAQVRQFEAHGFEVLSCLDLDGDPVEPGERAENCSELHYVARRVG